MAEKIKKGLNVKEKLIKSLETRKKNLRKKMDQIKTRFEEDTYTVAGLLESVELQLTALSKK